MAEATLKAKAAKTASAPFEAPKFELPKFELPKFEIPTMEIPAAYRELAEKSIAQAKQTYEKVKLAAEEASDVLETTYTTATKGASDYGVQVLEAFRANTNANFDFFRDLLTVKSVAEAVELSSAHTRKQFETLTAQTKDLTALAQKVTTETAEPLKVGFSKAFRVAA